jgi:hypothetical protein
VSKKPPRVPGTRKQRPVYLWPCGCVTLYSREGPLEADCEDPGCYRRNRPRVRQVRRP